MSQKTMLIASISALVLALFIFVRMTIVKHSFDVSVSASLKTSEGYDEKFIAKVNNLENILATRASFGYSGGKDPMTGIQRQVVRPLVLAPTPVAAHQPPRSAVTATVVAAPSRVTTPSDPVKLTAIIGDANDRHLTAIIMDGERSYSVDAGDMVSGRRITRITSEGVFMENALQFFYYDIYGKRQTRNKRGAQSPAQQLNH